MRVHSIQRHPASLLQQSRGWGQGHCSGAGPIVRTEWDWCRDHTVCTKNRGLDRETWVRQGEKTVGMRVALTEHRIHSLLPALAPTLPKSPDPGFLGWQSPEGHFTQQTLSATVTDLGELHLARDSPHNLSPSLHTGPSSPHLLPGSFPAQIIFLSKHNLRGG